MSTEAASVPWTPVQEAELCNLWNAGTSRVDIARIMGKTVNAVKARARKLKLRSDNAFLPWIPYDEKRLAEMWAAGVSTRQIAVTIGLSANAIKAKVKRLGLAPRRHPPRTRVAQRPSWKSYGHRGQSRPPSKPVPMPTTVPEPVTTPVGLLDRTGCAWPVNDGGPFLFCNHPTEGTYCEHHRQRMYRPW